MYVNVQFPDCFIKTIILYCTVQFSTYVKKNFNTHTCIPEMHGSRGGLGDGPYTSGKIHFFKYIVRLLKICLGPPPLPKKNFFRPPSKNFWVCAYLSTSIRRNSSKGTLNITCDMARCRSGAHFLKVNLVQFSRKNNF